MVDTALAMTAMYGMPGGFLGSGVHVGGYMGLAKPVDLAASGLTENNAGGFVHSITDFARFRRFLILGADSNIFYASAQELTLENAQVIVELLKANSGKDMVNEIVAVSQAGRAPRQSPGIFALAVILSLAKVSEEEQHSKEQVAAKRRVRRAAMEAIPKVCRTASTLYELMAYYKALDSAGQNGMGKWSHSLRKAVASWYLDRAPLDLAMQVTKYKTRNNISSRDLLRLAHPKPSELGKRKRAEDVSDMQIVLKYTTQPDEEVEGEGSVATFLRDVQQLKKEEDVEKVLEIIRRHRQIGWEHVGQSKLLKHPAIWAALLDQGMGLTALIRNLSRFLDIRLIGIAQEKNRYFSALMIGEKAQGSQARDDLVEEIEADKTAKFEWTPTRDYLEIVTNRITNKEALTKARIHPLRILLARVTLVEKYLEESLPPALLHALDRGFELSFANAKPTGKRFLVAMDVSGSMNSPCKGSDVLTCREAAAAISTILNRIESDVKVVAFSGELMEFPIGKDEPWGEVMTRTAALPFSGTDCSLPITYAASKNLDIDVFIVLTDNETLCGLDVPDCLRRYRAKQATKNTTENTQPAKMMVCAFSGSKFSIADPMDAGMLDVAGFDSALPEILEDFVLGSYASAKL